MDISISQYVYYTDIFGVIVFSFSGALLAGRYRLDPIGVMVLAAVTAVGGGTIRDIILGVPVFWTIQSSYIVAIFVTSVLTILLIRQPKLVPKRFMLLADAFGLAFFAVLGAHKAMIHDQPIITSIIMGTITGVAGGMLRDIICNRIPLILREEIYATAAILGSALYVVMVSYGVSQPLAGIIAIGGGLMLRLAGIYWKLSLPAFHFDDELK